MKNTHALLLGWTIAPIVHVLERYLFTDWQFLASLATVICIDTLLGTWLGWRTKSLSSSSFARLFPKVSFYALFLIATHAVATHRVQGELNTLLAWVDAVTYSAILARELLSILEKSARLGLFIPPALLVDRLTQLQAPPAGTPPAPVAPPGKPLPAPINQPAPAPDAPAPPKPRRKRKRISTPQLPESPPVSPKHKAPTV